MLGLIAAGIFTLQQHEIRVVDRESSYVYKMNFWQRLDLPEMNDPNYEFKGWFDDEGNEVDEVRWATDDTEYHSVFEPKTYSAYYYDGDNMLAVSSYTYGNEQNLQYLLTGEDNHPNESFVGWCVADDPSQSVLESITAGMSGDLSLLAVYKPNVYQINYELNGGYAEDNPDEYTYGEGVEEFKDAEKSGYVFEGWYEDEAQTVEIENISKEASGDVTMYAKWEKEPEIEPEITTVAQPKNSYSSPAPAIQTAQPQQQVTYTPTAEPEEEAELKPGDPGYKESTITYFTPEEAAARKPVEVPQMADDWLMNMPSGTDRIYCGGYSAVLYRGTDQAIVDAPDSCAFFNYLPNIVVIADHAFQGFDAIKVNDTMTAWGMNLTCVSRVTGYNIGSGLALADGSDCAALAASLGSRIVAYTCNTTDTNEVTITFWK